jgi:hypothetical protein
VKDNLGYQRVHGIGLVIGHSRIDLELSGIRYHGVECCNEKRSRFIIQHEAMTSITIFTFALELRPEDPFIRNNRGWWICSGLGGCPTLDVFPKEWFLGADNMFGDRVLQGIGISGMRHLSF